MEGLCVGFFGFFLGTLTVYFAIFYRDNGCAVAGHGGGQNCHTIRTLDLDLLHSILNASTQGHGGGGINIYVLDPTYNKYSDLIG